MNDTTTPRRPRVFEPDDPSIIPAPAEPKDEGSTAPSPRPGSFAAPSRAELARGFAWGSVFVAGALSLAGLAASLSFANFVTVAFQRDDWIGWTALGLAAAVALAGIVIVGREVIGFWRLRRLGELRKAADQVLLKPDLKAELVVAERLIQLLDGRPELTWALKRFREHRRDVRDPGDLLALADRELISPIDNEARRLVMKNCKRVAAVTAMSPWALIAFGFVTLESLRMMRRLATLYGGRPGFLGTVKLARVVIGNLIAAGGVALTDDLLGQFIGQDVLRRLSRRLGEGAFNGALVARLGAAAIEVARPLPFIETTPVRARDFVAELFRKVSPTAETVRTDSRA